MAQTIWITIGPPAIGKSTWAKQMVTENSNIKRINRDSLRAMLDGGIFSKENEANIVRVRNILVKSFLSQGYSVIIDDTNLRNTVFNDMKKIASNFSEVTIKEKHFPSDITCEELIERDSKRGEQSVGPDVIISMFSKWKTYTPKEDFVTRKLDAIPSAKQSSIKWFTSSSPVKPKCAIFDIDGTLALTDPGERDMYRWDQAANDTLNFPLAQLLNLLASAEYDIVILSGRSEEGKEILEKWLAQHSIEYSHLYMREKDNFEKDFLFKERVLKTKILPVYDVLAVFDDRDSVVDMWRRNGLLCLQVNRGDF